MNCRSFMWWLVAIQLPVCAGDFTWKYLCPICWGFAIEIWHRLELGTPILQLLRGQLSKAASPLSLSPKIYYSKTHAMNHWLARFSAITPLECLPLKNWGSSRYKHTVHYSIFQDRAGGVDAAFLYLSWQVCPWLKGLSVACPCYPSAISALIGSSCLLLTFKDQPATWWALFQNAPLHCLLQTYLTHVLSF